MDEKLGKFSPVLYSVNASLLVIGYFILQKAKVGKGVQIVG